MLSWLPLRRKRKKKRKKQSSQKAGGAKKPMVKRRHTTKRIKKRPLTLKAKARLALKKLAFAFGAIALAMCLWVILSLPSVNRLNQDNPNPGIVIYDSGGTIINSYGSFYGRYLHYDEIPEDLLHAVLATEDRNFFYHFGFDPVGLTRAIWANIRAGKVVQGGSTITQQIAKNLFLSSERTYRRKFKELLMAIKLEMYFSKEKLMEIYVNRVYLGAGTFGVDAASQRYFGKSATKVTMAEAAILTGLLKAPSRFAPTSSPERARKRAKQILINMEDAEYIDQATRLKAEKQLQEFAATQQAPSSNHYYYTDWIVEEIPRYIGEITEDIVVETTMSPTMQEYAEVAIENVMDETALDEKKASQAALIAMQPDGAVKAIMGGTGYSKSQFNRAVQSHRQSGSAFKLFVYLTALEQGAYPDMMVVDEPIQIGRWIPKNYGGDYKGVINLRTAVALSVNTIAVQISEIYGRGNVIAMARSLGVQSPLEPTPSLALGAYEVTLMEMATAFAHLAAGGLSVQPYGITKITNKQGELLYERKEQVPARALSSQVVAMANDVFSAVLYGGTAGRARIGRPAAGKTGTTSDYKDAWFIGYTPQLVAGVWVGNDEAVSMKKVTGGNLPAMIWRHFMTNAMRGKAANSLPIAAPVDPNTALPWDMVGGDEAGTVGGRHLPWSQRRKQPPTRPHDRSETKEFWHHLGLDN